MKKNPCRNCVYFRSENMSIYPPTVICGRKIPIRGVSPENGCLWFKKAARNIPLGGASRVKLARKIWEGKNE